MISSMTGYGSVSLQRDGLAVSVDVRSVNHRFLDLHVRLAREYGYLEPEITQLVRNAFRRGRVDVSVTVQAALPAECLVNVEAARGYLEAARRLRGMFALPDDLDLRTLFTLPGVLQSRDAVSAPEAADPVRGLILDAVREGLQTAAGMRAQEGRALEAEMRGYLRSLHNSAAAMRALAPEILVEYRQRLQERLAYIVPQVAPDPQRLAQEVALLAERSDVSEEIARLASHLDQFAGVLDDGREAGKKLDFLLQEMHREVNTVLSKTGHLEVTRLGIAMKVDIEKLREQVQNLE